MQRKLKMMVFALGVGIASGVSALPDARICDNWCEQCNAGSQQHCNWWWSGNCSTAGGSCFPL